MSDGTPAWVRDRDEDRAAPGPAAVPGPGTPAAAAGQGAPAADAGRPAAEGEPGDGSAAAPAPAEPQPLGVTVARTGNADVDAAVERLGDADELPVHDHIPVYEDVHAGLRNALAALDENRG
ncbi:hypothetical protein [Actinacidiphila acidipaludis]|uniref:Uncharacterized protein n=1 Tax=Actinacidiphila acidipaludis TaxID=2873382 RepID=A0ABS7Q723_9ACTN|nr:hypothetical protein [Streptomyces acidipaludis]MBY8878524.1 hypothetical protein [Streptomyces acidipaludis]